MALNLGATVDELQHRMSSREFTEWLAYERIQPLDPYRDDIRTALLCQTIVHMLKGKGVKTPDLDVFLLEFGKKEPQSYQEAKMKMDMFLNMIKAKKKKGR